MSPRKASRRRSTRGSGARRPVTSGIPFQAGLDPRRGRGPAAGAPNAGRPSEAHRAWCRQLLESPAVEKAVRTVLRNPDHPAFPTLWRTLADRAYGRAPVEADERGPDQAAGYVLLMPAVARDELPHR